MALTPSLLVPGTAEEMANYYVEVFPDGELVDLFRSDVPQGQNAVITANIRIHGTDLLLINGAEEAQFNDAFSLTINCEDQAEVDHFWDRFVGDGGFEIACGWCADKYGVRWQVTPVEMPKLLADHDPERANRAMAAMMTMKKIDLAAIREAADGAVTAR